jgi:hypothetical protein
VPAVTIDKRTVRRIWQPKPIPFVQAGIKRNGREIMYIGLGGLVLLIILLIIIF